MSRSQWFVSFLFSGLIFCKMAKSVKKGEPNTTHPPTHSPTVAAALGQIIRLLVLPSLARRASDALVPLAP
jgi:hypothetical protein